MKPGNPRLDRDGHLGWSSNIADQLATENWKDSYISNESEGKKSSKELEGVFYQRNTPPKLKIKPENK